MNFNPHQIYTESDDEPNLTFESNDSSVPNWLRFIKPTQDVITQNITLVDRGRAFFFEVSGLGVCCCCLVVVVMMMSF